MTRLPISEAQSQDASHLNAFAQKTHAALGADAELMGRCGDAFGPLWGIAYSAAAHLGLPLWFNEQKDEPASASA